MNGMEWNYECDAMQSINSVARINDGKGSRTQWQQSRGGIGRIYMVKQNGKVNLGCITSLRPSSVDCRQAK